MQKLLLARSPHYPVQTAYCAHLPAIGEQLTGSQTMPATTSVDDSFTSQIRRLTEENSHLKQELRIASEATQHEKECKEDLIMRLSESTSQVVLWKSAAEEYLEGMVRFTTAIDEAMQRVQSAKPDHSHLQAMREACNRSAISGLVSTSLPPHLRSNGVDSHKEVEEQ